MRRTPSSTPAYQQHSSSRGGSSRAAVKQESLDDDYEIEFSDVDDGDFVVGGGNTAGSSRRPPAGKEPLHVHLRPCSDVNLHQLVLPVTAHAAWYQSLYSSSPNIFHLMP
jgi:hypothetical protein